MGRNFRLPIVIMTDIVATVHSNMVEQEGGGFMTVIWSTQMAYMDRTLVSMVLNGETGRVITPSRSHLS